MPGLAVLPLLGGMTGGMGNIPGFGSKASIRRNNAAKLYPSLTNWAKQVISEAEFVAISHPDRTSEWIQATFVPRLGRYTTTEAVQRETNRVVQGMMADGKNASSDTVARLGAQRIAILNGEIPDFTIGGFTEPSGETGPSTMLAGFKLPSMPVLILILAVIGVVAFILRGK